MTDLICNVSKVVNLVCLWGWNEVRWSTNIHQSLTPTDTLFDQRRGREKVEEKKGEKEKVCVRHTHTDKNRNIYIGVCKI